MLRELKSKMVDAHPKDLLPISSLENSLNREMKAASDSKAWLCLTRQEVSLMLEVYGSRTFHPHSLLGAGISFPHNTAPEPGNLILPFLRMV